MDQDRYGLHILYLGMKIYPIVTSANIAIARCTNDQWSCSVITDDETVSNSEIVGDGKVISYDQVLMVVRILSYSSLIVIVVANQSTRAC